MILPTYKNMSQEKTLTCIECGETFEFTSGEQEFYKLKQLANPKRCKDCRKARKAGGYGN